jgi:hypothetical protein
MVGEVQKSHGARSELNSVFGMEKVDRWNPIKISSIRLSGVYPASYPMGTRVSYSGSKAAGM